MNVLMTILYILLFIFCLSVLIVIHELGHLTAAKIFKVYCLEYSIGFGPALIHKRRKGGETYFSLRVIPFGGYVSMYGEGVELEEGVTIDESRSLEGIKKWKKAIILLAGVTMNAVLALTLFFITNVSFSSQMCYYANMTIQEGSKAAIAGLKTGDIIALDSYVDSTKKNYEGNLHLIDMNGVVTYSNGETQEAYSYLDLSTFKNYKNLNLNKFLTIYGTKVVDGQKTVNYANKIAIDNNFKSLHLTIQRMNFEDKNSEEYTISKHPITIEKDSSGQIENFGYELYLKTTPPLSFGKAIVQSFVDFGESSTLIVRALGTLFTKETWSQMGGIVAIGFQSTSVLQNFGWGKFIYLWGALSVNLAIINLLPFPGLDGWQLLVLIVEGATKKKIPNKVKTIVSIVGLVILFAFMGVLLFKDAFTYIFKL